MVASADGLADALVERIKGLLWVKQGVEAVVLPYEDAAVETVVNAVAGFVTLGIAQASLTLLSLTRSLRPPLAPAAAGRGLHQNTIVRFNEVGLKPASFANE